MKPLLPFLLLLCFGVSGHMFGQYSKVFGRYNDDIQTRDTAKSKNPSLNKHSYLVQVFKMKGKLVEGTIYRTSDSAMVVLTTDDKIGNKFDTTTVKYSEINKFKIWRKGKVGSPIAISMFIGALTGFAWGSLASYTPDPNSYYDPSPMEMRGGATLVCGLLGFPVGLIIGLNNKESIEVDGDFKKFFNIKHDLRLLSQVQ